jgi:L-amino acid N-acyltransferase YncA
MAGEILNRRLLLDANIPTPYVLVTSDGVPCFIHWLIGPESNEKVKKYFKGFLPLLAPNEVMIEGAFMAPDYRGKGVMTTAVLGIVQKARELDARWVIAYVNPSRIASIRGVQKAGFRPWGEQRVKWRFFGTRFLNRRLSSAEIELLLKQWKQQTKPGV